MGLADGEALTPKVQQVRHMGLVTRCPACHTLFRVVPDQLRMSDGWARCGQCSEIFDAASSLQDDTLPGEPEAPAKVNLSFKETGQPVGNQLAAESQREPPANATLNVDTREAAALDAALQEIVAARPNAADQGESGPIEGRQCGDIADGFSPSHQEGTDADAVSFLRELPKTSIWRTPRMRALLGLASMGLLGVLLMQVAYHERDRVATLFPKTKALLESACSYLNCKVSLLKQIDSVVVESSTFIKIRNDTYKLSMSIKNNAPYELAMPALELTLTDAQDQALLRRVLLGPEINNTNKLSANSEWSGTVDLGVPSSLGLDRIAGYRILAFYP